MNCECEKLAATKIKNWHHYRLRTDGPHRQVVCIDNSLHANLAGSSTLNITNYIAAKVSCTALVAGCFFCPPSSRVEHDHAKGYEAVVR